MRERAASTMPAQDITSRAAIRNSAKPGKAAKLNGQLGKVKPSWPIFLLLSLNFRLAHRGVMRGGEPGEGRGLPFLAALARGASTSTPAGS